MVGDGHFDDLDSGEFDGSDDRRGGGSGHGYWGMGDVFFSLFLSPFYIFLGAPLAIGCR